MTRKTLAAFGAVTALFLTGCSSDAEVASDNLSKDADNFKIMRKIVFYNGVTNQYIQTIEGYCSIHDEGKQLEVTCKVGPNTFKKDFLGLSDNVTYFAMQAEARNVSRYHYKVIFKPEQVIPDVVHP